MTCQNSNLLCYLYLYLFCYWLFWYPSANNLVLDQHLISCTCEQRSRLTDLDRTSAIGQVQAGILWNQVAALFGVSFITKFKAKFHIMISETGWSGCPKKMTPLKDHFVILSALRSHGQTVQTVFLSGFVGQYAGRLSTHTISSFIGLPGALPWQPFTIRPFCTNVSNMSTGTWTCGGTWSSAVSPDFAYCSQIFGSKYGLALLIAAPIW